MTENAELIYGVNLGRLAHYGRLGLPESIARTRTSEHFTFVDIIDDERLEEFALEHGFVFVDIREDLPMHVTEVLKKLPPRETPIKRDPSDFYIGEEIKGERGGGWGYGDLPTFDRRKICKLKQNPSELMQRMRAIGLNVRKGDLRLYGWVFID